MIRYWNQLEGISLAGAYPLDSLLSASDSDAWYRTRRSDGLAAAVRVLPGGGNAADEQLLLWREAIAFDHPHIVRLLDAGRTDAGGEPVLYAVCEFPDDFLAGVLQERPLSPAETREVLQAVVDALRYVHRRDLVHAGVDPSHIMAFGESIKLPSDCVRRVGGAESQADDIWSLGITLHQMLTQQPPNLERDAEFHYMAEPFATVLRHALKTEPSRRWTIEDIGNYLDQPAPPAEPEPASIAIAAPARERSFPLRWVPAIGMVAALGLGAVLLRQPEKAPVAPVVSAAPATPAVVVVEPKPSPIPEKAPAAGSWRVIAWTYSTRSAAEHKVRTLNQRYPQLRAEVFAPRGSSSPYFVSLGGRMSKAEAQSVQRQARAKGLPRDTFVRNFSR